MKKTKKRIIALTIVLTLTLSLFSVAYASGAYKTITAWFGDIKIVANGKQISSDLKPIMINDSTYVPVRMLAETLGKNVEWNGSTHTVTITDKPDQSTMLLYQELLAKDNKIEDLEKKIEELENQKSFDLDDLEDDLMDDYEDYKDVEFEINLYGDEDDIEVEIYVDLYYDDDEWDDISKTSIKNYLQDIVDDILDEYEDADITGFIEDDDSGDELLEFTVSSKGKVSIEYDYADLDDLEDDLNDWYGDYENLDIDIDLYGDEDEIEVVFSVYEDEWDDLSNSEIDDLLDWVVDDILDEYDDADITGVVEDESNDEILSFYVRSNGTVIID